MSIRKSTIVFTSVLLIFFTTICFAQSNIEIETKEKKEALEQSIKSMDNESMVKSTVEEDASQRWLVSGIKISGNNLISTKELLKKMQWLYVEYAKDPSTGKPRKDTKGVKVIKDTYNFNDLIVIIKTGDEREVSLKTIQGFTKYLSEVYQDKGYRGIYIYVPKEAVNQEGLVDNILQIKVLEARVGEIEIERYDFDRMERKKGFLRENMIKSWSPIRKGDVIQKKPLDEYVNILNLNPDRFVAPVISRSTDPNALKLTYDVYEADPWHRYVQVDNSGTNERQWSPRIGLTNTNLTGMDDIFSAMYQAPWESSIDDNYALFGSYNFPVLTPRFRFNFYGGYSEFDVTPQGGPFNFLGRGSFYGGVLSYNVLQINKWFVDVTGSLSQENSRVTPALGLASDVDMDLWSVGINIHRSGDMSDTSLTFSRVESMGGSSRNDFATARLDTDPDFTIYNFSASHSQYLETKKVNRVSGLFRWITSNERLVPAKMTTFGGFYSVKGYEEYEIVADGGILISGQYEFDLVKHSESIENRKMNSGQTPENKQWLRKLAPLAFIDFGRAKIKSPVIGEREVREMLSVGVGAVADVWDDFSAGIYYGCPLRGTDETDRGEGRLHFSCIYRF